jgi:hypothetical protein
MAVHVRFVVDEVALRTVFLRVLGFPWQYHSTAAFGFPWQYHYTAAFGFPWHYHSIAAPFSLTCHLGDGQWAC